MTFQLPPLPYESNALEPYVSQRTMDFHYGRHHATYVAKLNDLIEGKQYAKLPLDAIVRKSMKKLEDRAIFNNAAQVWNHTFFWNSMRPGGGGEPDGEVAMRLREDFGSYSDLRRAFVDTAVAQFGSGWAWLVLDGTKLSVMSTSEAMNPMVIGQVPLLACDVWEHAYYLDYQNRRRAFVEKVFDHLANWDFVNSRLDEAKAALAPQTATAPRR